MESLGAKIRLLETKLDRLYSALWRNPNITNDSLFNLVNFPPDALFTEMESPDLPINIILNSSLPNFIDDIAMTLAYSFPPNFLDLRARARALSKKWRRLEAAATSMALSNMFPPSDKPAVRLPREVLMCILQSYVGDSVANENLREWPKKTDFLLDCILVAKEWSIVATYLLYHGIILDIAQSTKLLQAVKEKFQTDCPIRQLRLTRSGPRHPSSVLVGHSEKLISHCTELQYLDAFEVSLSFPPEVSLPTFEQLTEVRLAFETIHLVGPLLYKLPNLQVLWLLCMGEDWVNPSSSNFLEVHPPPTYSLKELHVFRCEFTLEQCQWLFSRSTAIDYVELSGTYEMYNIASVLGPHVKALKLVSLGWPDAGDKSLVAVIQRFTALTSLRVNCQPWDWGMLLINMLPASLEEFAISYSTTSCKIVAQVLSGPSWQPCLRVLTVFGVDKNYHVARTAEIQEVKTLLEGICGMRKVTLNWIFEDD